MSAGQGLAGFGGQIVETGEIPQWAFPGAHPATLQIRSYRARVLAISIPSDPAIRSTRDEIVAYCDQQIAAVEGKSGSPLGFFAALGQLQGGSEG